MQEPAKPDPLVLIGTETEFGIWPENPDLSHAAASALVVNAYQSVGRAVVWSPGRENPGHDLRGAEHDRPARETSGSPVDLLLSNGARLYVDHAHPEYSGPECTNPRQAACYDTAGETIVRHAAQRLTEQAGFRVRLFKNNSDGKGNSYGWHENYLISRQLPFGYLVQALTPFLVTRQIFTGAGKVGAENQRPVTDFQISARADFIEQLVGIDTTISRPLINTRDEPHADPSRFRRLHLICGDANRSEFQTWLKLGSTALVLATIEQRYLTEFPRLADPLRAVQQVSRDPELRQPLIIEEGEGRQGLATALEIQFSLLEQCQKFVAEYELSGWTELLTAWEQILGDLATNPLDTADRLDWTAKLRLFTAYAKRHGLPLGAPALAALNLQYHELDPDRSLYHRLVSRGAMRKMFTTEEIETAQRQPPSDTRAYLRGTCVNRFATAIVSANWDSLVLRTDQTNLFRLDMPDPHQGNQNQVQSLVGELTDIDSLLIGLKSRPVAQSSTPITP